MVSSRLRRVEEKNASRRMAVALIGSIALLVFLAIFGVRLLIGFSVFVDKLRGTTPQTQQQQSFLLPPVLDPLPEATNSATLTIRGKATPKTGLILYVDGTEYKKLTIEGDGTFEQTGVPVEEGRVSISAKSQGDKDAVSEFSNVISTVVDRTDPKLTIDSPADNATINDGTRKVTVSGLTDTGTKVTINGRIVVLKTDGSFTYQLPVNDGENKLTIISKDPAGNETKVERKITYQP